MHPVLPYSQLPTTDHSHSTSIPLNFSLRNNYQYVYTPLHYECDLRPKLQLRPRSICFFGDSKQTGGLVSLYYPAINKKYNKCRIYAPGKCSHDSCESELSVYQAVVHLPGFRLLYILIHSASWLYNNFASVAVQQSIFKDSVYPWYWLGSSSAISRQYSYLLLECPSFRLHQPHPAR